MILCVHGQKLSTMKLSLKVLCGQTQPYWVWLCETKSSLKANPEDICYRVFYRGKITYLRTWGVMKGEDSYAYYWELMLYVIPG